MKPLEGILVLEFAQFMAGPSAGLRLADLGARVIKIERPGQGEAGRKIALKNLFLDGSSLVFHTANRNKESYTANLKDAKDLERVQKLIARADVMTHNFRPGVMEKIGLDYKKVSQINSGIVYATVTGYGTKGTWSSKPGQDLLIQSMSGFAGLSGDRDDAPTPVGAAVSDIVTGTHLAQGILASLIQREHTGKGTLVEVSLLESTVDLQFELITTYLNGGQKIPKRAEKGNALADLSAPYGVYPTRNGHIVLAMGSVTELGAILDNEALQEYTDAQSWFTQRDEIMDLLRGVLVDRDTEDWMALLEGQGFWCAPVFDYRTFLSHEGYEVLKMDQELLLPSGEKVRTLRCPIRLDNERIFSPKPAPRVGQHTEEIIKELL
ncbi:MAG: CoA transferase [Bacteroidota bacterium]